MRVKPCCGEAYIELVVRPDAPQRLSEIVVDYLASRPPGFAFDSGLTAILRLALLLDRGDYLWDQRAGCLGLDEQAAVEKY